VLLFLFYKKNRNKQGPIENLFPSCHKVNPNSRLWSLGRAPASKGRSGWFRTAKLEVLESWKCHSSAGCAGGDNCFLWFLFDPQPEVYMIEP